MNTKTVYVYDPETGESLGAYKAQESPLDPGVYLIPEHSSVVAPPAVPAGYVAVFTDGAWVAEEDHRGAIVYDQTTGSAQEITAIGSIPAGCAFTPPPPTLLQAQSEQIAKLSAACQAQIYAGFQSSALGAAHTYPAKDKDQANLSGSVVASLLPNLPANWTTPFWCEDGNGAWAFVPHTAAQIQQVGSDGKDAIVAALGKNANLAAQVMAASDVEAVLAIVW
jgi:hypothetical protein